MAQNEYVDNLVAPGFHEDLAKLIEGLNLATESMAKLSEQGLAVSKALGDVKSLKGMVDTTKQATDTNNAMHESVKRVTGGVKLLSEEQAKLNLENKIANDATKLNIQLANAQEGSIAKAILQAQQMRNELKNLNVEQEKYRALQLKNQIQEKDDFIKRNVDLYSAQKLNVGNYPQNPEQMTFRMKQIEELNAQMAEMERMGLKDTAVYNSLQGVVESFTTALGSTSGRLTYVINEMNTLASSGDVTSERFKQLAATAAELKAEMAQVGIAINNAAANSERGAMAMEALADTMKEIGRFALQFFAIQEGLEFISGISEEFGKADAEARKLRNTLDNVGSANLFGKLTKEAEEFAEKFKYLDTYEVQGVFTQLITYGKLSEEQIKEALPVIIDFAAKTGKSIGDSASVIIKALEGNSKGLKEFGINIKDAKDELGKAIPQAERFGFIMENLKPRVKGAAETLQLGFDGWVAGIKKNVREIQLALADYFVAGLGIEQADQKKAAAAKREATEGQALVKQYDELSKQINKTAGDKKAMADISNRLVGIFGDSIVQINKETGAIELNIKATKDLITQRILLADTVAAKEAMKYNNIKEEIFKNQEEAKKSIAIINEIKNQPGTFENTIDKNVALQKEQKKLDDLEAKSKRLFSDLKESMENLEAMGYKQSDIEKLYNPGELGKQKDPGGGGDKPDKEFIVQNEKALTNEMLERYKLQTQMSADKNKVIADDEKENYQIRKDALIAYNKDIADINKAAIINEEEQTRFEIAHMEKKPKESDESFLQRQEILRSKLLTLEKKMDKQVIDDARALKESLKSLDEETIAYNISLTKMIDDELDAQKADEIAKITRQYEKGKIDKEKFEKEKLQIERKYTLASLTMKEEYYKSLISNSKAGDPDTKQYQLALQNIQNQKKSLPPAKKETDNPLLAALGVSDKQWEQAQKVASEVMKLEDTMMKAVHQRYQVEIDMLNQKKQLIDDNYTAEVNAVNGSFQSEQKKQAQIAVLNAQKAQADKEINDEIKREKMKMAAADKAAAIAKAIEGTATAVVSALEFPVLAAAIAAAGAAEIALIASTPLPQYGTGTEDHPGGAAIVGELNRPEWVYEPGKAPYMVNRATRLNLARHTRVIPEADLLKDMSHLNINEMGQIHINTGMEQVFREQIGTLGDKMDGLQSAIINKKETHFHWSNGELRKSVRRGGSQTDYLNNNF